MARILIIDDDILVQKSFSRLFKDKGHEVICAATLSAGREEALKNVDVIYLDLDLPDGDGLGLIDESATFPNSPEVIVITGMGSDYAAQKSMESNAWDYISKPASPAALLDTLESALTYRKKAQKAGALPTIVNPGGIIGQSPAIQRSLQEIGRASASDAGVLIRGETGVGKELAARAVHLNSQRSGSPFVVVDCSSLSESLVESILYGHVKGAFTGAHAHRKGLVAQADRGTLFLDEVGELPLELQKSFLRVLQEHRFRPVGAAKEAESDFRLVAATNRDLSAMAEEGTFRSDLLYRLQTIEIVLPPLRERGEDIGILTAHCIETTCDRYGIDKKEVSDELLEVVGAYHWPGNVRELMNVVGAAVIQAGTDPVIYPKHLPAHIRLGFLKGRRSPLQSEPLPQPKTGPASHGTEPEQQTQIPSYAEHKRSCDRRYFTRIMQAADNDISQASQLSGLSVPSIYRHLSRLGIPTKKKKWG
ncbi:sigma-54 interaction domain protein [delta proteobacterium NaphS2]|nr:sigma-54 interaction domain protein [delta proteobacterium NaphS2]